MGRRHRQRAPFPYACCARQQRACRLSMLHTRKTRANQSPVGQGKTQQPSLEWRLDQPNYYQHRKNVGHCWKSHLVHRGHCRHHLRSHHVEEGNQSSRFCKIFNFFCTKWSMGNLPALSGSSSPLRTPLVGRYICRFIETKSSCQDETSALSRKKTMGLRQDCAPN
jgi:hypothetical protein